MTARDKYNWAGGVLAVLAALVSIWLASKGGVSKDEKETIGKAVVAFWAIFPPAFFWIDWVYFCKGLGDEDREIAKHTHDLARNIWLGLLGVMTLAFFKLIAP